MIPRLLEIKNFLSYGQSHQMIDFTGYSLICLSGKNGHGKSALLDAITWALWGQARKITTAVKADEGLIRLGQTQMMVSLEFEMSKRRYRVRREYAKTYGKPYAMLDFELFDHEKQGFVSLTDKTIKATQEKIEQTINLDFETFINSAFLRQGHANEFSNKSPKERKQVLATILGFATYDRLYRAAQDKVKVLLDEQKLLKQADEVHRAERERDATVREQLIHHTQNMHTLDEQLRTLEDKLVSCQQAHAKLETQRHTYEQGLLAQQKTQSGIHIKNKALRETFQAWRTTHKELLLFADRPALEKKRLALLEQERMFAAYEKEVITVHMSLEKEQALDENLKNNMKEKSKNITLTTQELRKQDEQINVLSQRLAGQAAWHEHYEQQQKIFEKRKQAYQRFLQKKTFLINEQHKLTQQKKLLDSEQHPSCPLCSSHLTHDKQRDLCQQFIGIIKHHGHQLSRLDRISASLKAVLVDQRTALTQDQAHYKAFVQDETRSKELIRQRSSLAEQRSTYENELTTLTQTYKQAQEQTALLSQKLNNMRMHCTTLNVRPTLALIEAQLQGGEHIQQEHVKQQERRITIKQFIRELKELKKQDAATTNLLLACVYDQQHEQQLMTNKKQLEQERACRYAEKESCAKQIGRLEESLAQIEKLHAAAVKRAETLQVLEHELYQYQTLAEAFSKNGIQALLIEEAIPEIEDEANNLLAKLTSNQSQVFIESLRDLKSGGVKETLDIKIADAQGIRSYELFSGGESFRIDFALRIAISKLLARRAGTSLQTLIIDEGFGSQDEEGLSRLMQAIHAVQHDFEKVIIVSHMNEFKDNFPVHFVVEKTTTGSTVRIEERG